MTTDNKDNYPTYTRPDNQTILYLIGSAIVATALLYFGFTKDGEGLLAQLALIWGGVCYGHILTMVLE